MRWRFLLPLVLTAAAPAHGQQGAPQASAYRQVMQAQYAAEAASLPARPEEARRIYESYLRSLGQAAKEPASESRDSSTNSGGNAGISAH
jgi:hypothetical protein